jgi:hypothetical protein
VNGHRDNVIPLRPQRTSERLEALARQPWAYNRKLLLELAERARAIEALDPAAFSWEDES